MLNDLGPAALTERLTSRFEARPAEVPKLLAALHGPRGPLARGEGLQALSATRGVRRAVLEALVSRSELGRLRKIGEAASPRDGFQRTLFETHDGHRVEAVRIPLPFDAYGSVPKDRLVTRPCYVVCVSSQVGCALACGFCATGKLGFKRNLAVHEIVEQVRIVRTEADRPIRGVVFMGMGEPFLNYDRVIAAAQIFSHPAGYAISPKRITISTAGVVPAIRRFTQEGQPYRLSVSLTAATSAKRREVMPIEDTWPLETLWAAVREHQRATGERASISWVAIDGFNTGEADVAELRALAGELPLRLDLIEVADPDGKYRPPSDEGMQRFQSQLRVLGQPIVRRYSGGRDIRAGCGMLAASPVEAP